MYQENTLYTKEHAEFLTVTCLEWKPILEEDRFKNIIIDSLSFLTKTNRVIVYAFVIMNNHFHLIWQIVGDHKRDQVQRDFLKFTSQQILKILRNENSPKLLELLVQAKDRKYQVWERNSLGVPLWSGEVIWQKLDYIHNNPVKAGLCKYPEDYKYSSANFIMVRTRIGSLLFIAMDKKVRLYNDDRLLVKNTNKGKGRTNLKVGGIIKQIPPKQLHKRIK